MLSTGDGHAEDPAPRSYERAPVGDAAIAAALVAGRPVLRCTSPDLERAPAGRSPLLVAGWATCAAGIESVRVSVDGNAPVEAVHGLVRPDLRGRFGDAVAAGSGFAIRLGPELCPPGRHELTIVAIARDGSGVEVGGAIDCLPDTPANVSPPGEVAPLPTLAGEEAEEALVTAGRFVPGVHRQHGFAPEHYARYGWAAQLVAGKSVLDAGCGTGWGTALLAAGARRAVGVDASPLAVAAATDRHGRRAEFDVGDLRRLPFADGELDAVVCFEAIEHVPDPEPALAELRRVLTPGGLLLISAANRAVYPPGNPFHLNELTSDELRAAVARHFANVAVHRQHTYFASLLTDDSLMATDDPSREVAAEVAKIVATAPGSELYAVVAASDGELPPAPAQLVLGSGVDHDEQRRLLASWQERAISAELDAAALRTEIAFVRSQQEAALWRASREPPRSP